MPMNFNFIDLETRFTKRPHHLSRGYGPSWDKVAEYPLIYLLDLGRTGWQVQSAPRQEIAGKR